MDVENNRYSQPGPLLGPTHGPVISANTQPAASMENTRLQGQSSPLSKETNGTLLPADLPAANNGRPEAQSKSPTKVTYGAPKGTDLHNNATRVHSGNFNTRQEPRSESVNGTSNGTTNYTLDWHCRQRKSAFQNSLEHFTPVWIAIPMNTGILSILMHQLPYQFHGLQALSTIMYLLDLALFVIVCCVTILRWTLYPKVAQRKTAASIDEISFLGAGPITLLTLASLTGLIVSNSYWGGHAWSLVAYVMWWIGMLWMMVTCVGVCITIFKSDLIDESSVTPTLFVPAVGIATAAVTGGQVVVYAYDISPRLAVPVVIVAYFLAGLAIWLSIILYGVFFQRLMASGWPAPVKRPTLMILVGPFGQTSAAMQALATAVMTKMDFAGYQKGTFLQASAASSVSSASIVVGLLLLGHDIFWIFCCLYGVLEGVFKRQLSYNLTWWATIFPVATMATAFIELSISMDSPTFRVLATALLLLLLVNYFVNWGFTLYYIITSDLLFKKADKDMPDEEKLD